MNSVNKVVVFSNDEEVGTIAQVYGNRTAFQYSASWLRNGFSISPISLPLMNRVFISDSEPFDGLFGVFNDSLPDGWGRLVTDRYLKNHGVNPLSVTPLTRLTLLGPTASGSLHFEPTENTGSVLSDSPDLDMLYRESRKILRDNEAGKAIDEFFIHGSSSNGARPKIELEISGEPWIVKFPSVYDSPDMGVMEYDYNRTAEKCGIETAEFRLLESGISKGFFASKRFDRPLGRIHMVSVAGLLETSHREPALDYSHLFKLSWMLSKNYDELEKIFALMCFNVFSHNQDDHSKNFSFIHDTTDGIWRLSPAYDLTYSMTAWNEQATTVGGKGKDITTEDLVGLGRKYGLDEAVLTEKAAAIKATVESELAKYLP